MVGRRALYCIRAPSDVPLTLACTLRKRPEYTKAASGRRTPSHTVTGRGAKTREKETGLLKSRLSVPRGGGGDERRLNAAGSV